MIENKQQKRQYAETQKHFYSLSNKSPHIIYTPEALIDAQGWYHPLLGYPVCPLIGRYNKGEYRIGDVVLHCEFVCEYDENIKNYRCGNRKINIPDFIVYNLRNIPEVIPYNKPKNLKNEPDVHLTHHLCQKKIKLNWIISFGQVGKDFLNYLNHCYVFDQSVFYGDKLNRTTCNIPIFAYMPQGSGLCEEEVERGICMTQFRSQYMSIHLKGGAPAFSPNNMRLGVFGMKKVSSGANNNANKNQGNKQNNKKKKYKPKLGDKDKTKQQKQDKQDKQDKQQKQGSQMEQKQKQQKEKKSQQTDSYQMSFDWQQVQRQLQEQKKQQIKAQKTTNPPSFRIKQSSVIQWVHFYTCILLQNDHRVNYHWHIEDAHKQEVIKQLLDNAKSIQQFMGMYVSVLGSDALARELTRLLGI